MKSSLRFILLAVWVSFGARNPSAQVGPPAPADTSAFRGSVFEILQQKPLPYEENFSSLPVGRDSTQSVNLVQIRQKLGRHYHAEHDEIIYIISGRGIMTVGSEIRPIQPGDVVVVPRRTAHGIENRAPEPLVALSVMSPPFDGKDRILVE